MSCKLSHWTRVLVMLRACSTGRICLILWTSFGLVIPVNAALRIFPPCVGRFIGSPGWAPILLGWLLLFGVPFTGLLFEDPFPLDIWLWGGPFWLLLLLPLLLLLFDLSPFPPPRFPFLCLRYFTCRKIHENTQKYEMVHQDYYSFSLYWLHHHHISNAWWTCVICGLHAAWNDCISFCRRNFKTALLAQ